MGKKGAQMVAREPAANIKMADLAEWWVDISSAHGVRLAVEWELSGSDDLALWRFTVRAYRPLSEAPNVPFDTKSLVWPTASHKTVLGALLWLLVTIDDDLSAGEALAGMRSAGI